MITQFIKAEQYRIPVNRCLERGGSVSGIFSVGNSCNLSDAKLVELYNSGNSAAFTVLSNRYFKLIRSITAKYNISGLESDDLTQEGLLGLLSAVKTYSSDKGASFKTYAALCINRRIITLLKRSDTNKSKALNDYISLDDENIEECFRNEMTDPEASFIGKESLDTLKQSISECLSKTENRVLELYLAGESYSKIAQRLELSQKSVDNAIQRIRRKLRKHISNIPL